MITQMGGYIKGIVVQFGSRMAIKPSSCETIVGMYNIHLNNEKVQKKVLSVQYEYRCIQCSVRTQMIMCECLDYYVFYLEYVKWFVVKYGCCCIHYT